MWKLPLFEVRTSVSGKLDTDLVGVFQEKGKKPALPNGAYGPLVEKYRQSHVFTAHYGAVEFVRFSGKGQAENVLFVGLGKASELDHEKLRRAGGHIWSKLAAVKSQNVVVDVQSFLSSPDLPQDASWSVSGMPSNEEPMVSQIKWIRALAEGMILCAYQFKKYRTKGISESGAPGKKDKNGKKDSSQKKDLEDQAVGPEKVIFQVQDAALKAELELEIAQVQAIGEGVRLTRDWSNEPSNFGTPAYYAGEAAKVARESGLKCRVLTEKEATREKMGLFLGVGAGSAREGRIVILEYTPKKSGVGKGAKPTPGQFRGFKSKSKGSSGVQSLVGEPMKTLVLVGKGITFDSGGISIKPSMRMEEMKHDMTGAATVMGAILLASRWKVPNRVVAIMGFTENMPDGEAIQPGNVLTARNGKTVEIINTDAEGRLILADLLDFAQDFKPDAIVDVATLTGAVSIALGKLCCGILGNDQQLIDRVRKSGEMSGERIWQLPLFDEYFDDMRSDCADMKNAANDGNGGTIRGAIFLKQFIKKGMPWAHLDIAATGYNLSHLSYFPKKGASGAYVRTLAQLASDL